MCTRQRREATRSAFTLMEMLVVVAILVVLAGAAVPIYMRYLDETKITTARLNCKTIAETLETYKLKMGDYPANLEVLIQVQQDGTPPYFAREALMDPWQHEYQYAPQGQHNAALGKPDVWSQGPRMGDPNSMI